MAIILKAISQKSRVYYALVLACHFIYIFSSSQKKFAKKGNCGHRLTNNDGQRFIGQN